MGFTRSSKIVAVYQQEVGVKSNLLLMLLTYCTMIYIYICSSTDHCEILFAKPKFSINNELDSGRFGIVITSSSSGSLTSNMLGHCLEIARLVTPSHVPPFTTF